MGVFTSKPSLGGGSYVLLVFYIFCALNRNVGDCVSDVALGEPHTESGEHPNNVGLAAAVSCHPGGDSVKCTASSPPGNDRHHAVASKESGDVEIVANLSLGDENLHATNVLVVETDVTNLQQHRELTYQEAEALDAPHTKCRMVYEAGNAHCWINLNRDDAAFLEQNLPPLLDWIGLQLETIESKYDISSKVGTVTNAAFNTSGYALSPIWALTKRGVSKIRELVYKYLPTPVIPTEQLENSLLAIPKSNTGASQGKKKEDKPKLRWYQFGLLEKLKFALSPPNPKSEISLNEAVFVEKLKLLNIFYGKPRQDDSIDTRVRYYAATPDFLPLKKTVVQQTG